MNYVKQTINEDKEKEFMYKIAEFYSDFLVSQYKVNSATNPENCMFTEEEKALIISLTASQDEIDGIDQK